MTDTLKTAKIKMVILFNSTWTASPWPFWGPCNML